VGKVLAQIPRVRDRYTGDALIPENALLYAMVFIPSYLCLPAFLPAFIPSFLPA
jgi:hypothetical protein